ncbi:galactosylceramide sulfotransferase-like [Glandiceps talaboti]
MAECNVNQGFDSETSYLKIGTRTSDKNNVKKRCCYIHCCSITWKKGAFLSLCFGTVMYLLFAGPHVNSGSHEPLFALCFSVERIVFIKTHKTASTTLSSILQRYGYLKNLDFALPYSGHIITETVPFERKYVKPFKKGGYHMLTNHARYNRAEMNIAVPNAVYITILREPSRQLESAFGYYKMAHKLKLTRNSNPFEAFMEHPDKFLSEKRDFHLWTQMRNGQIFDLGLDHRFQDNDTMVDHKILQIEQEFELVLINEYFNESLLILKRLLCWNTNDVLYISNSIRGRQLRYKMNDEIKKKARNWNKADVKLYDHFNRTLWKKISEYGPNFERDLVDFTKQIQSVKNDCIAPYKFRAITNHREERLVLKSGASAMCKQLWFGDVEYTELIRNKQRHRLWMPQVSHGMGRLASTRNEQAGSILIWVWVIVVGGLAWCIVACCVAAHCERSQNGTYDYDDDEDDDDDYYQSEAETDYEIELRRKYLALIQNAHQYRHCEQRFDNRKYAYVGRTSKNLRTQRIRR